ncbi:GvpL/GvpF family gas vesicle protein [Desulfosporosinus nitroreducens]|uniref:GvpL/GvpF family gas vesicle protein n=1 Tax=Desulfosporosinus nitroreducens TaxID=2018668 RepID=UPI00207CA50B|nr:GvpL/GvpF family gas vesicle protein [Desulfosporosinus nitroreducens]MCO1603063.1 GvpL/GvpF family gas vesicle protein [Desulfosporosinus nitroreducens]
MEYLYLAMFLQELGKEINETNIQRIFAVLDMEADEAKVQFLIPALSVLTTVNRKTIKKTAESSLGQQISYLQKRFEVLENSLTKANEKKTFPNYEESGPLAVNADKEKVKEADEPEHVVNTYPVGHLEDKGPETVNESFGYKKKETVQKQPARYVYGIADQGIKEHLGPIGLDGKEVYTIPYKDTCVIVHDCSAEPYKSEDENVVKEWLFTQQEVLDSVAEKFGVVLPMSFDMIVEGKNGSDPDQGVREWLEKNYENFRVKMSVLKDKQEYGVQVILDTGILSEKLIATDEKLRIKKAEIDTKPEGIAYMEKEILKDLLKEKVEESADQYFREFYHRIKKYTEDIVIGKAKKVGGNQQMLMNLSCLVKKDRVGELGNELEKIENVDGISVRFSGPWAPYSFVTPEKGVTSNGEDQSE